GHQVAGGTGEQLVQVGVPAPEASGAKPPHGRHLPTGPASHPTGRPGHGPDRWTLADALHLAEEGEVRAAERFPTAVQRLAQPAGGLAGVPYHLVRVAEPDPVVGELVLVPHLHHAGPAAAHHIEVEVDQVDGLAVPPGRRGDVTVDLAGPR